MINDNLDSAVTQISNLIAPTNQPDVNQAIHQLQDYFRVGDISNSVGIAIGKDIQMVVNQLNLPPEVVAAIMELRNQTMSLLGVDPKKYWLEDLILDKMRGFIGRDYVFRSIEEFITRRSSGYFVIIGDPGLGKSAIVAEYLRRTGCIAHFNTRSRGIVETHKFLESVCAQLIVHFGLPYKSLPSSAFQDSAFFSRLLREASEHLGADERLVIAVDALDEVDLTSQPNCSNVLCLPESLPDRVYFIMTRRPVDVPLSGDWESLNLMDYPAENRSDIEHYLQLNIEHTGIRNWIDAQQISPTEFVGWLVDLSESNFMYLAYILPEIEKGVYLNRNIRALPRGLVGYYKDHWNRMGMDSKPLPREKILIVYMLSEVSSPISRGMITQILQHNNIQVDELSVQAVLDDWAQFLHEQQVDDDKRYSVYHASFRDFLQQQDKVKAAGGTIKDVNSFIANYLWEGLFGE